MRDEFLSEEDLDLKNLTEAELYAFWDLWLRMAQATNDLDAHLCSHGVIREEPGQAQAANPPGAGPAAAPP